MSAEIRRAGSDEARSTPRVTKLRRTLTRLAYPSIVVALVTWAIVGSRVQIAGALGLPVAANEILLFTLTGLIGFGLLALLERLVPYRSAWQRSHGDVSTDWQHFVITGVIANAVFRGLVAGVLIDAGARLTERIGFSPWPSEWPALAQLLLALVVAEFGHYWLHRFAHEVPLLWRFHAVHHSAPRLYWLNAARFHPLDLLSLMIVESGPLLLLGIDSRALLMFLLFRFLYGQVQHCNIDLGHQGPLDWIFSSHELHRWHHSRDPREGNSNYGAALSCWDQIFRTFFRPSGRDFDAVVGVHGLAAFPQRYIDQVLEPFRRKRMQETERSAEPSET